MVVLSAWDKIIVVGCGLGIIALALFLVICVVTPFCPLHQFLPERARLPITSPVKRRKKKWLLTGSVTINNADSETLKLKNGSTYISYSQDIRNGGGFPLQQNGETDMKDANNWGAEPVVLRKSNQSIIGTHQKRPSVLTTRESTVDSTYSSMTPTGSRPSTPISSKRSSQSDLMLTENLSNLGDVSSVRSADISPLYGTITVSLQLCPTEDDNNIRLVIEIKEAQDLPARDTVACGDPFFRISIIKESCRAFRKRSKSKADLLSEFVTNVQKKTRHPIYNETFSTLINKSDIKDCEIHLAGFDKDKYANPTEFGIAVIHLKNIKLPLMGHHAVLCLELAEPKRINGEIQLGLMYLPTAERMAFSNFKLTNIPIIPSSNNEQQKMFIRVMALHNGKMVGKKKTEAVKHNPPTATIFDDSLAFDVPTDQLSHLSFVVVVVAMDSDSQSRVAKLKKNNYNQSDNESTTTDDGTTRERFIGKVALGPNSKTTGLQHWEIALHRPREQIVLWHVLR